MAKFQPYKHKRSNTVGIVMLLTLITASVLISVKFAVGITYLDWVYGIALTVVAIIPLSYILFLAITHIRTGASQCFGRSKVFLLERMSQIKENEGEEEPVLLNQEASGHNTFPNCTY